MIKARLAACALAITVVATLHAQVRYNSGQTIAPVFEGWERNDDGTFNMVFGYMNRNYEEILDVAVGPDNRIEPGNQDQGQPTYFFPRRQPRESDHADGSAFARRHAPRRRLGAAPPQRRRHGHVQSSQGRRRARAGGLVRAFQ